MNIKYKIIPRLVTFIISITFLSFVGCGKKQENMPEETVTLPKKIKQGSNDTLIYPSEKEVNGSKFLILTMNPRVCYVSMADNEIPDIDNKNIALCVEAAFTGEHLDTFKTTNIAGDYVIEGRLEKGYDCPVNTGLLCSLPGMKPQIANNLKIESWLKKAAEYGGNLFQQVLLIHNFHDCYNGKPIKRTSKNIYRAACILKDKQFAIIQSLYEISLGDYIKALSDLNVKDALYLDMGFGWNYGWYRETSKSKPVKLFEFRSPYQTNWLVIRTKSSMPMCGSPNAYY